LIRITGKVKICAESVSRKFCLMAETSCFDGLFDLWHSPFRFAKIIPRVARKDNWKERSFIKFKLNRSIVPAAKNRLSSPQFSLPKQVARSETDPMIAALTIEGDAPTNKVKMTIRQMVTILEAFLPKNEVILAIKFTRILTFMPERAMICKVPVTTRALYKSFGIVAFTPKRMPPRSEACGSGRRELMMERKGLDIYTLSIFARKRSLLL